MRLSTFALLVTAVTTLGIGCQSASEPASQVETNGVSQTANDAASADTVFVSLKVPNMV